MKAESLLVLAQAIESSPPGPCDDGCPVASQCAQLRLACGDYLRWYRDGRKIPLGDRLPLRVLYNNVFRDAPEGKEPGVVRLRGRRRRVAVLLRAGRIKAKDLPELATKGFNLTRYIKAKAGG